jgi:murein DD-endopeptidase MepM/ murein hydrolase activator NlpD
MQILLPSSCEKASSPFRLCGALGAVLLCGSLAGLVSTAISASERSTAQAQHRDYLEPTPGASAAPFVPEFTDLADSLAREVEHLSNIPSILPTLGRVSSPFSLHRYHPILHVTRPHEGVDIAAPLGTPVVTRIAGRVTVATTTSDYGLLVEVDHGRGLRTRYGHLLRVQVREGQWVTRGQLIGAVGNSGLSTGPHLHYEVRVAGQLVDPLRFSP